MGSGRSWGRAKVLKIKGFNFGVQLFKGRKRSDVDDGSGEGKVVRTKATENGSDEVLRVDGTTNGCKFVSEGFGMLEVFINKLRTFGEIKKLITQGSRVGD